MIWRKRAPEQHGEGPGRAVTPADAADLAAARAALQKIQSETEVGRSRWPVILAATSYLRRVHDENHLADDLKLIFTTRQRGL